MDCVIFDLDGTLLDTSPGLLSATKQAILQLGLDMPNDKILRTFIGPPMPESFEREYGMSKEDAVHATEIYIEHYLSGFLYDAIPYEGIFDLCRILKDRGVKLGVATYKGDLQAHKLLSQMGFDKYLDAIYGTNTDATLTKEYLIEKCLNTLGSDTDNAILIGDSIYDAEAAKNAGIPFIAVTYGFGFKSALDLDGIPHVAVCDSVSDILSVLTTQTHLC